MGDIGTNYGGQPDPRPEKAFRRSPTEPVVSDGIPTLQDLHRVVTESISRSMAAQVPLSEQKCGNCLFWEATESNERKGYCRRYPPVLPSLAAQHEFFADSSEDELVIFEGIHPMTSQGQWCGEWRMAPKVADAEL